MSPAWFSILAAGSPEERVRRIEALLAGDAGEVLRGEIGGWVMGLVPIENLVPESAHRWRPLVADALQFVFSRLSHGRLAAKIAGQLELPGNTPPEKRLIRLISRMPGLQKMGQVLARNPRLSEPLRQALTELENGMSDLSAAEVHAILHQGLDERLEKFAVRIEPDVLSEASVSAVIRFTWKNPDRERERCVFKVLKPHVPACYAEDMSLLQRLGEYLAGRDNAYSFAVRDVDEMLTEVRLLLERELDFAREQATLGEAQRIYRSSLAVRVPRVIPALSTPQITAMTEETGVKVTSAFRRSPIRRRRIAAQVIEALIAVPLFSSQEDAIFHADPHAGNLLYDPPNRELIVLDWALAERLSLRSRRHLVMLAAMAVLRSRDGVRQAILGLESGEREQGKSDGVRRTPARRGRSGERTIERAVDAFFDRLPAGEAPGVLDAMQLLDEIALEGVHFAAPLFLFRKSLFTLDGVLNDIAGREVRMDEVIVRHFLTRWAASFGLFYSPLTMSDFLSVEWNALLYSARRLARR